jgi:hypothetical protein
MPGMGLHWIGPVPASDCPDLTALPASARAVVDKDRFGGLTGYDTRRVVYGTGHRRMVSLMLASSSSRTHQPHEGPRRSTSASATARGPARAARHRRVRRPLLPARPR